MVARLVTTNISIILFEIIVYWQIKIFIAIDPIVFDIETSSSSSLNDDDDDDDVSMSKTTESIAICTSQSQAYRRVVHIQCFVIDGNGFTTRNIINWLTAYLLIT
jgi:hypothetical protein